ncbi:histamine receptor H2a isoform X1 [Danio rerio]|uniref:Histamine H2 receptor n=2 Tax=Danio rerio TaxID=7955 RepID=A0A2R8Q9U8_DANRE|nr:histamine receptor H2a [Danio rerio]|eukprot:NP_001038803.2 histamine H2 receptor [Danio rerio]
MTSQIALAVTLSVLILLTVSGNILVCLAVYATRRLRNVTNCFIVSLAVTDFLLGALVLPFSTLYQVTGDWPLGAHFCNIYISLDVMLCTASILNLFAISLDRYFAVTAPLRYPMLVLPWRVGAILATIWLVSVGVSFVPIHLGWNTRDLSVQNIREGDHARDCRFELNPTYAIVDAFSTFYLPLLAMCWSYHRVFRIARMRAKRIISTRRGSTSSQGVTILTLREHKATVTLAVVLGAFVVCWFPYFTFFTIMGIRNEENPPQTAQSVVLWLGYANSALNPVLYATLNRDFRSAYAKLLCGGRRCKTETTIPIAATAAGTMTGHAHSSKGAGFLPRTCVLLKDSENRMLDDNSATNGATVTVVANGSKR